MERQFLLACAVLISLLALQGSRLAEAQGITPSELCGLEGFELDTLSQPTYWSVTIDRQLCLIPQNYTQVNITNCVVYMSVCKALPPEQCGGQTNSSTCQEVTMDDGYKQYFSVGDYRGNEGYVPLDDKSVVGFVTIRQGDTGNSLHCNETLETSITWTCVKGATWDPTSHDATTFLRTATKGLSHCELIMSLSYDGACYTAPTLAPDTCELSPYDVPSLAAQEFWYASVSTDLCYNNGTTDCKIYVAFCQALPLSISNDCYGAAVCQIGAGTEGEPYAYNMGKFNDTRFLDNDESVDGGFHMDVENGSLPNNGLCDGVRGLNTRVVLVCDSTADWDDQDISKYIEVSHDPNACFYQLDIPYSGACIPVAPTLDPSTCALSPYDVLTLANKDYWYASVPAEVCFNPDSRDCRIYFAFCQGLPHSIHSACYGAAVCQVGTSSTGDTYAFNMGKFNNLTRYVKNDDTLGVGFHIDVDNGTEPANGQCNHLQGLKSRVILVCNKTAQWSNLNRDVSSYVKVVHVSTDACSYLLEVQYSGACNPGPPPPSPVGWILIGLFFFAVIVYLVVGTGFQYIVKGARGLEMIPNYPFWAQFFFMVLEGCKFSLDIITCFQCDGKMKPSIVSSAGRGGVEYDKI